MTELVHRMLLIRYLEARLQELCDQGHGADLHFNRGQEAISVGVCAALRLTDRIVTHHRTIAHYVAKIAQWESTDWPKRLYPLVCEVLNRSYGINRGLAGEMHINNPALGYDFSFQLVATCIPVAAGLAWAIKHHRKTDEIVTVFCGDAATANGQFHEGLNIAAVQRVPLLVVIEDNRRAGNITSEYYQPPTTTLGDRFVSHGIPHMYVNGNNVNVVREAAGTLAELARTRGPQALICKTERLCHHKQGQRDVRTPAELEQAALGDPLRGVEIPEDIKKLVDSVIERALAAPMAEEYVYG